MKTGKSVEDHVLTSMGKVFTIHPIEYKYIHPFYLDDRVLPIKEIDLHSINTFVTLNQFKNRFS